MAKNTRKAKNKLPSGNIRIQKYDYTDENGKKHYKSFTAPTRNEALFLAAQWAAGKEQDTPDNLSIHSIIEKYLDIKRQVLSPSTMRSYEIMHKNYFSGPFGAKKISGLSNSQIQLWISSLCSERHLSPKTIRNAYGLLTAALEVFYPEFRVKVTLPARIKPDLYTPSDSDMKRLLSHIQGTELEIAVYLAAFGPLRRGEICALQSSDIHGNEITVSKSMVLGPDGLWYVKQPKTYSGYRTLVFPSFVIERIKGINGRIIKCTPNTLSDRFTKAVSDSGLPHFRFHDLRHYSASVMHAIGVPDQYIMQRGGWSSDFVMKSVYRNVIDLETVRQNKKIVHHFEKISHKMSHEA